MSLKSLDTIRSYSLQAEDGDIGKAKDFFFRSSDWNIRYFIVKSGGWFSGKDVLISPFSIIRTDPVSEKVFVNLQKKQIEAAPHVDTAKPVSRRMEELLAHYYEWPIYWVPGGVPISDRPHPTAPDSAATAEDHSIVDDGMSLRSVDEVLGYHIEAVDGSIGHAEDFLAEEFSWQVRYLVVDTRNLLPGKKVPISPDWIQSIDWGEKKIFVDLPKSAIRESPALEGSEGPDRAFEKLLYNHFGRPVYWP